MAHPLRLSHNEIYTAQRKWCLHLKNVTLPVVYYDFFLIINLKKKKMTDIIKRSWLVKVCARKTTSETLDFIFIQLYIAEYILRLKFFIMYKQIGDW